MADRSTAALGVANEDGEAAPAALQEGATSDGTTTDDQNSGTSRGAAIHVAPAEQQTRTAEPAQQTAEPGPTDQTVALTMSRTTDQAPDRTAGKARGQSAAKAGEKTAANSAAGRKQSQPHATAPELHSGHKLARRYQLAECVTRVDGFSSWRAVDEKLRRAVGIHVLPAEHPRARPVLAAARSAALLGDPRFVQVLDAVEENDLVYVIHEWLPDAVSLADMLTAGPLDPHEAYQMAGQVSQGMAAAHREGLAHLRLDPGDVLRTVSGQYRIRGLAVAAALRGLSSDRPQGRDTESIGALLYAALTQRWPYEEDAHGLTGLPKGVGLVAPDQVRAGVHRGLSEIAMRALVNDGATASREIPPCTTPEELAKAIAGIPRIRPPEHAAPVYQPAAFRQPPPPGSATRTPAPAPAPPPTLPGRTGKVLKWAVSALLIVAIGLGSWQLADALKSRENHSTGGTPTGQKGGPGPTHPATGPVTIARAKDFDPFGDDGQHETPTQVKNVHDGDRSTYWQTSWYTQADLGGLKPGVGVVVDLGSARNVSSVKVDFAGGDTSVQLMTASQRTSVMPTTLDGFTQVAAGSGTQVTLTPGSKVTTRYVLVWLTKLPPISDGRFRGKIAEINVTG